MNSYKIIIKIGVPYLVRWVFNSLKQVSVGNRKNMAKGNAHQIRNIEFAIRNYTFLLSTLSQQLSACSSLWYLSWSNWDIMADVLGISCKHNWDILQMGGCNLQPLCIQVYPIDLMMILTMMMRTTAMMICWWTWLCFWWLCCCCCC